MHQYFSHVDILETKIWVLVTKKLLLVTRIVQRFPPFSALNDPLSATASECCWSFLLCFSLRLYPAHTLILFVRLTNNCLLFPWRLLLRPWGGRENGGTPVARGYQQGVINVCLLRSRRKLWENRWSLATRVTIKLGLLCDDTSEGFLTPRPSLAHFSVWCESLPKLWHSGHASNTHRDWRVCVCNGPVAPYVIWSLIIVQVVL